VIRAATGEVPVFDGSAVTDAWSAVIHLGAAEHVVVAGLEIRSCTAPSCQGIDAGRVLDLTVRECHLHHLDGPGMRFTGQGIRLEANHVHDVALTNVDNAAYPDGGWPTCLGTTPDRDTPSAPHATDVVIRLNRIVDCWGEGIGVWFARSAVIEHNVVDNAWNVGIYLDNSPDVSVTRNVIRMTRGMHDGAGTAILMGSEPYVDWGLQGAASEGIVIVNNVAIGGGGIGWWSSADVTDANTYARVSILHNTVVATLRGALGFDAVDAGRPAPSDVIARNNVFLEAEPSWIGDADLWALGGNAWVDAPLPDLAGGSDVALALAAGEISWVEDARALAAQVGEGEAGTGVTQDLGCAWRDESAPTRGAFEF
jgi:parallel beta-helix repeat protein